MCLDIKQESICGKGLKSYQVCLPIITEYNYKLITERKSGINKYVKIKEHKKKKVSLISKN